MSGEPLGPLPLTRLTREIYAQGPPLTLQQRLTTVYRPLYGDIGRQLVWIPAGASYLDIGCGTGALLLLAERLRQLRRATGLDPQARSIAVATGANRAAHVEFHCTAEVPAALLADSEVISMIDVIHHVPPDGQLALLDHICRHAAPGARLIIKDLDPRPRWRALANRITDWLSTRSRVHYRSMGDVAAFLTANGFTVLQAEKWRRHVWSPYQIVAEKDPSPPRRQEPWRPGG